MTDKSGPDESIKHNLETAQRLLKFIALFPADQYMPKSFGYRGPYNFFENGPPELSPSPSANTAHIEIENTSFTTSVNTPNAQSIRRDKPSGHSNRSLPSTQRDGQHAYVELIIPGEYSDTEPSYHAEAGMIKDWVKNQYEAFGLSYDENTVIEYNRGRVLHIDMQPLLDLEKQDSKNLDDMLKTLAHRPRILGVKTWLATTLALLTGSNLIGYDNHVNTVLAKGYNSNNPKDKAHYKRALRDKQILETFHAEETGLTLTLVGIMGAAIAGSYELARMSEHRDDRVRAAQLQKSEGFISRVTSTDRDPKTK